MNHATTRSHSTGRWRSYGLGGTFCGRPGAVAGLQPLWRTSVRTLLSAAGNASKDSRLLGVEFISAGLGVDEHIPGVRCVVDEAYAIDNRPRTAAKIVKFLNNVGISLGLSVPIVRKTAK